MWLDRKACTREPEKGLVFAIKIRVAVPDYEVDNTWWFDDHVEGASLYEDMIYLAAIPPAEEDGDWQLGYGYQPNSQNPTQRRAQLKSEDGKTYFELSLREDTCTGLKGQLRLFVETL